MLRYFILFVSFAFILTACNKSEETQTNDAKSNDVKTVNSQPTTATTIDNPTRLALVIGNENYQNLPRLANSVNDANDMASVLTHLGFKVMLHLDVNRRAMIKAIQTFGQQLRNNGNIGLFYFSGHGLQSDHRNYLVPVDANILSEADIQFDSVDANRILAQMEPAQNDLNIVVLDTCRDNLYEIPHLNTLKKGFAKIKTLPGSLVVSATTLVQETKGESTERNSLYTKHLLTALRDHAHLDVVDLFAEVTKQVMVATEGKQVPWQSDALTQRFCFGKCDEPPDVSEQLQVCNTHFEANRLINENGDNAFTCYKRVLKIDRMNAQALARLEQIEARYILQIEQALEQEQFQKAKQDLANLRQINPKSSKLVTLEADLQALIDKLLNQLTVKQESKPANFEAEVANTEPKSSQDSEISRLLPVCNVHFQANRLTSGRGGNALACYEEVLKMDKTNAQALAGLAKIEARYVTWITQALEQQQLDKAKAYLTNLYTLNPESPQWIRLEAKWQSLQHKHSLESQLQVCQAHFEANRLTMGEGGSALPCYKEVLKKYPSNIEALAGLKNIEARYITWIEQALDKKQENLAKQYLASLRLMNPELPKLADLAKRLQKLARYSFAPGKIFRDQLKDDSLAPEMIWIPAGRFQMGNIQGGGDSDEKPVHWVSVNRFAIGRYEVTFAEYDRFVQVTGRKKPDDEGWGRGNRPVINISWFDAIAYAEWLTLQTGQPYRLPTEAEWEYAARANTTTQYWWGKSIESNQANCKDCGSQWDNKQTAPVGHFAPNLFGLHDTAGNVYEWTCSEYEDKYSGKEQHCVKTASRLVLRGGAWNTKPQRIRSAFRNREKPSYQDNKIGFRLVSM